MVPFTLLEANDFDDGVNAIPYYFVTGGKFSVNIVVLVHYFWRCYSYVVAFHFKVVVL